MTARRFCQFALFAVCVLAAPLTALAQQVKVTRLGLLTVVSPEPTLGFLREALRDLGYVEGKNLLIEVRSAEGKPKSIGAMADELVRLKVDIIVAFQTPAVQAVKKATTRIPIVMYTAGDAVGTGLVASLARPGGNITGNSTSTAELAGKLIEIIREIRPAARSVGVLANIEDPFTRPFLEHIRSAGRGTGVEIRSVTVRGPDEYDAAFSGWARARVDAVIVQPSLPRKRAIELALKLHLLSVSPSRVFAEDGGLIAYSASPREMSRKTAAFVDKILKGSKPAELPVELPTKFDLVVNLKTAKALGLKIPESILFRADRVIE